MTMIKQKENQLINPNDDRYIVIDKQAFIPISGFEDRYSVDGYGNVKHNKTGRIRKPQYDRGVVEYPYVVVRAKGRYNKEIRVKFYIHRLLALHFIPNPNMYKQINHIDGNKQNSVLGNIEWVNATQNQIHALSIGLKSFANENRNDNGLKIKLNWDKVNEIRRRYKEDNNVDMEAMAEEFGVKPLTIKSVIFEYSWKPLYEEFSKDLNKNNEV